MEKSNEPCCEDCANNDMKCWDRVLKTVESIKDSEQRRHQKLIEAGTKVRDAVEEFLNGREN